MHIEDICRAFQAVLEAPRDVVHNQAFNVGRNEENYRIREVAAMVEDIVPNSHVEYSPGGGPDKRCYRVDCSKIQRVLPSFKPVWTVPKGIEELYNAFRTEELKAEDFNGHRYIRIKRLKHLLALDQLNESLRWKTHELQTV